MGLYFVQAERLELSHLSALDPKSSVSTNSTTPAFQYFLHGNLKRPLEINLRFPKVPARTLWNVRACLPPDNYRGHHACISIFIPALTSFSESAVGGEGEPRLHTQHIWDCKYKSKFPFRKPVARSILLLYF